MAASKKSLKSRQTENQRQHVLKLVGEEMNGEGDKKHTAIAQMLRDNPDLAKQAGVLGQTMSLYKQIIEMRDNAATVELDDDRNTLLSALIPIMGGRRSHVSYGGNKRLSVSAFLRQKVGDYKVDVMLRLEAMNAMRWEAQQRRVNRYYEPYEDAKEISKLFFDIFKDKPGHKVRGKEKKLVPQFQQTVFDIVKPHIETDIARKDDLRFGNAIHVLSILEYPIRYALDETVKTGALNIAYRYIDTLGEDPKNKIKLFTSLKKMIAKKKPDEATYIGNKIDVVTQEQTTQEAYDTMMYKVQEKSEDSMFDEAETLLEVHTVLVKKQMDALRQKRHEFALMPVPQTFQ